MLAPGRHISAYELVPTWMGADVVRVSGVDVRQQCFQRLFVDLGGAGQVECM